MSWFLRRQPLLLVRITDAPLAELAAGFHMGKS